MGRGGPPEPMLVEEPPGVTELLARSRAGSHAASDYLEDAALARVTTIGARRCGGGLAGAPYTSNVEEAARMAAERRPDLVLLEGSGTAIPPVEAGARVLVAGAAQDPELVAGYLGAYRVLLSDLVVITGGDSTALREAIAEVKPIPVVATRFRPAPAAPVEGRRVAVFTTAPERAHAEIREELERAGADVELVSGNLADRDALREDRGARCRRRRFPRGDQGRGDRRRRRGRRRSAGRRSCSSATRSSRSRASRPRRDSSMRLVPAGAR